MEGNSKYRFRRNLRLHRVVSSDFVVVEVEEEVVEVVVEDEAEELMIPSLCWFLRSRYHWTVCCQ
jgi:hypothetical protein